MSEKHYMKNVISRVINTKKYSKEKRTSEKTRYISNVISRVYLINFTIQSI